LTETKIWYFHLHADGKTVREISQATHHEMYMADLRRGYTRRLCRVRPDELVFTKGKSSMYVPMAQLQKILEREHRCQGDSSP